MLVARIVTPGPKNRIKGDAVPQCACVQSVHFHVQNVRNRSDKRMPSRAGDGPHRRKVKAGSEPHASLVLRMDFGRSGCEGLAKRDMALSRRFRIKVVEGAHHETVSERPKPVGDSNRAFHATTDGSDDGTRSPQSSAVTRCVVRLNGVRCHPAP